MSDIRNKIETQIQKVQKEKGLCIIAIDGMSASGKTTLGEQLHTSIPESNLFHMDDFFLQSHQRTPERLSEIGGNVDYERFKEEIVCHLSDANGLHYRTYNCKTQTLSPEIFAPWKPLVIIEGAYSQHPYFGQVYDIRLFCEISPALQRQRILKRNGPEILQTFEEDWIPKELAYFEKFHIRQKSGFLL